MLRMSCRQFLNQCRDTGFIAKNDYKKLEKSLLHEGFHTETRTLLMMTLMPRMLHKDSVKQAAYIKAALIRVRSYLSQRY